MSKVELNEGLLEIGSEAFKNCLIESVVVPSTVNEFGREIFDKRYRKNNNPLIIYCYPGSKAVEYGRLSGLVVKKA